MNYLSPNTMMKWCMFQETTDSISDSGELSVSLLHNENNHRLTVSVLEARNLKVRLWRIASIYFCIKDLNYVKSSCRFVRRARVIYLITITSSTKNYQSTECYYPSVTLCSDVLTISKYEYIYRLESDVEIIVNSNV